MKAICDITYEVIEEIQSIDGRAPSEKKSMGTFSTIEEAQECGNKIHEDAWTRWYIKKHFQIIEEVENDEKYKYSLGIKITLDDGKIEYANMHSYNNFDEAKENMDKFSDHTKLLCYYISEIEEKG